MTVRPRMLIALVAVVGVGAACGSDDGDGGGFDDTAPGRETTLEPDTAVDTSTSEQRYPVVIGAEATPAGDGTWTISATLSSPYDTPDRYADAWRVLGPDGSAYGVRVLTHDHANEQPFTRSQSGIEIPDTVDVVTIQGRDLVHGWGGATFELRLR